MQVRILGSYEYITENQICTLPKFNFVPPWNVTFFPKKERILFQSFFRGDLC